MQRIVIRFWYACIAIFIVGLVVAPLSAVVRTVVDEVQQRVEQVPEVPQFSQETEIVLAALPDDDPVAPSRLMAPTLASGGGHSCVITRSEQVVCWGGNGSGQLGNGSDAQALPFTATPVLVSGMIGASALALGDAHSCALLGRSGQVWCWGSNDFNQLGSAIRGPMTNATTAQATATVGDVVQLVSGANHLCVLQSSGQVWCWGDNRFGQLASDQFLDANTAVLIPGIPANIAMLSSGANHTCALSRDGQVWCWGDNQAGQIDDSGTRRIIEPRLRTDIPAAEQIQSTNTQTCAMTQAGDVWCWGAYRGLLNMPLSQPAAMLRGSLHTDMCARFVDTSVQCWGDTREVRSIAVAGVTDVAVGYQYECVLLQAAQVLCRGDNQFGQIAADSDVTVSNDYLMVALGAKTHSLSAGDFHFCAAWQQGKLRCWGRNLEGQLGDPSVSGLRESSEPVNPAINGIIDMVAAGNHTCVIRYDRTVNCWGDNASGQLGVGDTLSRATPAAVWSLGQVRQLSAGSAHTCALQMTGEVWCWGDNTVGQLGFVGGNQSLPYRLDTLDDVVSIASGGQTSCALRNDATVVCWGAPLRAGELPFATVDGLNEVVSIGLGVQHACALLATGAVACWGDTQFGQYDATNVQTVSVIDGLPPIRTLSVGGRHTCAIDVTQRLWCWGWNAYGQVSNQIANPTVTTPQLLFDGVSAVAVGFETTCARLQIGETQCWGDGSYGQLGNGAKEVVASDPYVRGLADGFALASGGNFTCALLKFVMVRCWGGNEYGQLGNGTTAAASLPQTVRSNDEVVALAAGSAHACSLISDGTVRCWGHNNYGQLGNEGTENSDTPVVAAVQAVVELSLGQSHSCALLQDGGGACWGRNDDGQLGSGNTVSSGMPLRIADLDSAVQIAAGGNHTCAVLQDTTVRCWGRNEQGQLASGDTGPGMSVPVFINGLANIQSVALGDNHSCALSYQGEVWCWGWNQFGQVGMGQVGAEAFVTRPQLLPDVRDVVALTAGGNHTCTLQRNGVVRCWGDNFNGQLGSGVVGAAVGQRSSSSPVVGLNDAIAISAGRAHTCALLQRGDVACWGWNLFGQLGNGASVTVEDVYAPRPVVGLTDVVSVGVGVHHLCAVDTVGTVWCWGDNEFGQLGIGTIGNAARLSLPNEVDAAVNSLAMDLGANHSCALLVTSELNCWGRNEFGQVGNAYAGDLADTGQPNFVSGLIGVSAFATGGDTSCAVVAGEVYCWGDNQYGQIGYETVGIGDYRTTPTLVPGISDAVDVSVGLQHVCALLSNDTVACWGRNNLHQVSADDAELVIVPTTVPDITDVISLTAGAYHNCVTKRTGRVVCWGGNQNGQLGVVGTDIRTPQQVVDVDNAVQVSAGLFHTCALLDAGQVRCWGDNVHGQLGSASGDMISAVPARDVPDLAEVVAIESGGNQSCVLRASAEVWCWGENTNQQLGVDPNPDRSTPAMALNLWSMRASVVVVQTPTPFPTMRSVMSTATPTVTQTTVPTRTLIRRILPTLAIPTREVRDE